MKGKKLLGWILVLVLVAGLWLPSAALAEKVKTKYSDGSLVVRKGPSVNTGKASWVKNGQEITVLERGKTWSKIRVNSTGKVGYINTMYITKSSSSGTADKPSSYTIGHVRTKYAGSTVNMRKGAGTNYGTITELKSGAKVFITGQSGNWYKIQTTGGNVGWMSKNYITIGVTLETTANVNLRKGASTNYGVIKVVPAGTDVSAVEVSGNWTKVRAGSSTGWIYSKYLN